MPAARHAMITARLRRIVNCLLPLMLGTGAALALLVLGMLSSTTAKAAGPTFVSGGIFANTTWSLSQSPYIVTGPVTLFPGYTLTVEPGVEVRFVPTASLTIRGALVAEGSISNTIVFTSTQAVPTQGSWPGLMIANSQGGRASIKFAHISYASTALSVECCWSGGPVDIADSVFSNNGVALGGYAGWAIQVDRCTFDNNTIAVTSADKIISNSVFTNNVNGLYQTERVSVHASTFISNQVGLNGGRGVVDYSTIISNGTGVQPFFEGFSLSYDTITSNTVGVILGQDGPTSAPVHHNNIYSNTAYNMQNGGPSNKDASYNWWGTTNTGAIQAGIYDGHQDGSLGLITYEPVLQYALSGPISVTIGGVSFATASTTYNFTATVNPISATLPITYVWQASGQALATHIGNLSDVAVFNWNTPNTKTVTVIASNGLGSVTDTITITVDDIPVAVGDVYSTPKNVALVVAAPGVLSNDSDIFPGGLNAQLAMAPVTGTLVLAPTGAFTYTPPVDFVGLTTFTYRAGDGMLLSTPAVVTITVKAYLYLPMVLR